MSGIVKISDNLNETGKYIYKTNPHFQRLANIMEHPEFREFYNEYMQDWDSVKMIVMFMKIYEAIEKHSNVELTPFQKLSIVKEVIDDGEMRKKICESLSEWIKKEKIPSLRFEQEENIVRGSS